MSSVSPNCIRHELLRGPNHLHWVLLHLQERTPVHPVWCFGVVSIQSFWPRELKWILRLARGTDLAHSVPLICPFLVALPHHQVSGLELAELHAQDQTRCIIGTKVRGMPSHCLERGGLRLAS